MHYVHHEPAEQEPSSDAVQPQEFEEDSNHESADREVEETSPQPPIVRLKQAMVAEEGGPPVSRDLRGYEVAPDQYVVLHKEEIRQLRVPTSREMQVVRSVRLAEIDPVFFDTSYYMVPDKQGERAYALLFAALRQTQYVALATVAMHGREHVMIVRPGEIGLLAHTMFYTDEIRKENGAAPAIDNLPPKELAMATKFIEAIAAPFAPEEFTDRYRKRLQEMIDAKVGRREVAKAAAGQTAGSAGPAPDILEALKQSLAMAKKPVKSEPAASKITPIRRQRGR
jgi:DNA end-binding protein Ku